MDLAAVIVIVMVALSFDFTNGFHDAANAIATSVSTRALTPRAALAMAAVMNLIGAHLGTGVAKTVGSDIIDTPTGRGGLLIVFAALIGAIAWNLVTWRLGLPTSSSHALIGGLVGAALGASSGVKWNGLVDKVVIPMLLSPLIGFAIAYLLMVAILWLFRRSQPKATHRRFKIAQTASAAAMGLGHGLQDAQKTMGVIVLAMVTVGYQDGFDVPEWVIFSVAIAMAAGTYAGGWRIIRTLGRRIVHLDPPRGFAAEVTAASVLYATAFIWKAPISTTQTITAGVLGAGATRRFSAVRWGIARNILVAWALTLPGAGLVAAATYVIAHDLFRI
ncbi:anion permease [Embleya sp. NBC_00896]|uniref:inorganic phosphate transporter n=1 Tax=Embleya sp. NBC_00896 TaxID=2975961 RepID=UPI00386EED60|nr:inorganic phosphate transporter [Embleya sp. NBC_00896]